MASGTTAPPGSPPQAPPPPDQKAPSRGDALLRNRKRLILALALIVLAIAVAIGSAAVFSSSEANPSGTLAAGSLTIDNESDKVIFNTGTTGMTPGDTATGEVTITNTGESDGTFTVTQVTGDVSNTAGPNGGNLSEVLQLTITDYGPDRAAGGGDDAVVHGPSAFGSPFAVALPGHTGAAWAGGEAHRFRFSAEFPDAGNQNQYQGSRVSTSYTWDAVTT